MAFLLVPFFMPLVLIRWVFPEDDERELDAREAEAEQQFGETWALLYGRESDIIELDELDEL